jgi:hypothetical protein
MKRHVAATVLGVLAVLIVDSHLDWVPLDQKTLLQVNGQSVDVHGWVAEQWRQLRKDCRLVKNEALHSATADAVLQVIAQHSPPNSLDAQLLQLHTQADWGMAEVEFKTLNPSIVVLHQADGRWQIQDAAVWSGATSPWTPADFVRRYLRQKAPQMPQALLDCMPIDERRYAAAPARMGT